MVKPNTHNRDPQRATLRATQQARVTFARTHPVTTVPCTSYAGTLSSRTPSRLPLQGREADTAVCSTHTTPERRAAISCAVKEIRAELEPTASAPSRRGSCVSQSRGTTLHAVQTRMVTRLASNKRYKHAVVGGYPTRQFARPARESEAAPSCLSRLWKRLVFGLVWRKNGCG